MKHTIKSAPEKRQAKPFRFASKRQKPAKSRGKLHDSAHKHMSEEQAGVLTHTRGKRKPRINRTAEKERYQFAASKISATARGTVEASDTAKPTKTGNKRAVAAKTDRHLPKYSAATKFSAFQQHAERNTEKRKPNKSTSKNKVNGQNSKRTGNKPHLPYVQADIPALTPLSVTNTEMREMIWQNLDLDRTGPHFSPSFKPLRLQENQGKTRIKQKQKALRIIPLSGLCEVGRNMTVIEYGNDMIIVDCGVSFPDESHPGIDSIIPNMEYVFSNLHKLRGIFITHGHEDHIGAISWLLNRVDAPLYTLPLPASLIRYKLEDRGVKGKDKLIRVVHAGDFVHAGCMKIEYIHVNHSIADACALAITTPEGVILHTGDFKIDYTPINGEIIDLPRLSQIGSEGILLLMCESTNVERPGFSPSERVVGESFADIFANAKGRVIVATFSSNVYRIQQIIDAAERHKRKVALIGRSMQNVFRAADSLGYIHRQADTIIDLNVADQYSPEELVIITTGSQGEPMAALTRMAFNEHRKIEINEQDTVIISATPIPGNEKPIYRVINELYKKGAKVIYSSLAHIHVSGHAYREEIKLLHKLLRPKYFIPIHGEYRMLHMHGELAHEMGQPWDSIYILNNGDVFQISGEEAAIVNQIEAEPVLIDGTSATTIDNAVLESRRILAEEGIVVVSLCVDHDNQGLATNPAFQTRGFVYQSDLSVIQTEAARFIHGFIRKVTNNEKPLAESLKSHAFREQLQNLFYQQTSRRPIVLVSVLEI